MSIFQNSEASPKLDSAITMNQGHVLLVDDDKLHRSCLKAFLTRRGYTCIEAENGVKGLDVLRQESISIIITDNNMPEMDGLTLIEHVKHEFPHEIIPIFLLTAEVSRPIRLRAFKNGVYRVFEKPLDFQELCYAVDWVTKFDLQTSSSTKVSSS